MHQLPIHRPRFLRFKLIAAFSRIWRWEFWPAWLFYIPLIPWIAYLSLRHRGLGTITASNPAIPQSGIVGESKYDILRQLPAEWTVPTARIEATNGDERCRQLRDAMNHNAWSFPIILKPDVGERGANLRLVHSTEQAERVLSTSSFAMLMQTYHPGPHEAGVFYYRIPGESHGRIFSITHKKFPAVTGDGRSTIEELIWRHPRYRMQARRFLARLGARAKEVLEAGEPLKLATAGNHCQGAEFRDGSRLITPALTQSIDNIARSFGGFYFGRFDIRYESVDEFRAGRGFSIIELNGASSESTNLYDPDFSLISAYRILFKQWALLFAIGSRNRRTGHRVTTSLELLSQIRAYYRMRQTNLLAD